MEERNLGDYQIIKPIGQGSLGKVYLAEHRFMKQQFVVKVLPEELATDRGFIQRFEEVVGRLAQLEHPNLVKIHNVSYADGCYFLVTDCVVDAIGETTHLGNYLLSKSGQLDEKEILTILRQVAEALDYLSKEGVVHRSLKLNNILIGKSSQGIKASITDFGLSKVIGEGVILSRLFKLMAESLEIDQQIGAIGNEETHYPNPPIDSAKLSRFNQHFIQNYAFLAPEQKQLILDCAIGQKVDVWAFGVLAFYLLTQQFPAGVLMVKDKWNQLIHSCLQRDPANRAELLSPLVDAVLRNEGGKVPSQQAARFQVKKEEHVEAHANVLKPVIQDTRIERPELESDPASVFNIESSVTTYQPEKQEIKNLDPIETEMVIVQGGKFQRGSNDGNRDEMPRHQVSLSNFAIDVHPVTNEQFVRFLDAMGGEKDSNHNDIICLKESRIRRAGGQLSIESGYSKHPVVGVTWYGAVAYAMWVGKRLPTEVEWEVAARAGLEAATYPTGDSIEKSQANFFSSDTTAVMSYPPNAIGLYDMAGNVYEWCQDWYAYNYYETSVQEPENPQGPLQGVYRVLRGACWKSSKEDCRCSKRHRNKPGAGNSTYGFRCTADVASVNHD